MKKIGNILHHIFIDGLSAMALGLFSTLIIGTIIEQIGNLLSDSTIGSYILFIAGFAKALTGAGIAVAVASAYGSPALVTASSAICGLVGAFAGKISISDFSAGSLTLVGPGEPLGAFVAAFVGIELGRLVSSKTKLDIIVTPIVTIASGCAVGILLSPPIAQFMKWVGSLINYGVESQPFAMGIIVSVLMGIALTLPISSAAIGVSLGLSGIAAGAAVVGCSAQMVGFAVMSFRENGWNGIVSQGIGTSMLQMSNIIKNPLIWLPPIISSAILGPISTCVFGMVNNATGSGMGTSGLVGQIMGYQTMTASGVAPWIALLEMLLMHFVAPGVLSLILCEGMRKLKLIKSGDLKLSY